jgi:hypothetical protein
MVMVTARRTLYGKQKFDRLCGDLYEAAPKIDYEDSGVDE